MKIGLRAGHSDNCTGAIGIVDEHEQMKAYYTVVKSVFEQYGHTVIDCNSNGSNSNAELSEGASIANSNDVDLFISLHMNASDGQGHGVEAWVSSTSSKAYSYADNLCTNFSVLGFSNRGVKTSTGLYEMNHVAAPNIIFEICFCDNETDMAIYNQYSWEQLAYNFCNAIDSNIPKECGGSFSTKLGWNESTKSISGLSRWWYCTDLKNAYYYKDVWEQIDGEWYSFDSQGYARESEWFKDEGKWYYLKTSCKMAKNEWIWVEGECYCFDIHGALYIDIVTPDGYKVDKTGAWVI